VSKDSKNSYHGIAAVWLDAQDIRVWSKVSLKTKKGSFKGLLLPRSEQGDDKHLVIKLTNGYNIAINLDDIIEIKELKQLDIDYKIPQKKSRKSANKPTVVLLGTGGTVASRLDYETGAVIPAFSTQELYNAIPEIRSYCNLETKSLIQKFSENIEPNDWVTIANEIVNIIENSEPVGIVITHGTDTLQYTAAALAFMLKNLDRPIILTGAQRSSDRPSSDAAVNLIGAVNAAANTDIAEVIVCMHASSNDDAVFLHRGTRVRKMHTSRRDAFKTIGTKPIARIEESKITYFETDYRKRGQAKGTLGADVKLEPKVALVYFYPSMKPEVLDFYVDKSYRGLVLAGTGLGHVSQELLKSIERAKENSMPIFMTSQCFWGHTNLNVYETGRRLLERGVVPLGNMLPEVALVKAMWVLGHTTEIPFVKELMQKNLAGEMPLGEKYEDFMILQAGLKGTQNKK